MKPYFKILRKLLSGDFIRMKEVAASYDGVPTHVVSIRFEQLELQGHFINVFSDVYVVNPRADEEKALKEMNRIGNLLSCQADTRTKVSVSGELTEDNSFKTEESPSEIVK